MNVVMTGDGKIVEVQATGEKKAFSEDELNDLLKTAKKGVNQLFEIQKKILGD
jgi:ribonuclease PH